MKRPVWVQAAGTARNALILAFSPTRRNVLHWLSWGTTLGLELFLVWLLWQGEIYGWEEWVTRHLQDVPGKSAVFELTSPLTNTISLPFAALFLALLLAAWFAGAREAVVVLALSFPAHVLAQFPKALVDRPRPSSAFEGIDGVGGFRSFPSGHSEFAVSFYGFLTYLLLLQCRSHWQRVALVIAWLTFVLATGFGRVAAGRHWPLDVLASYVIGLGLLSGLIWLHTLFRNVKQGQKSQR